MNHPFVAVLMGSDSDLATVQETLLQMCNATLWKDGELWKKKLELWEEKFVVVDKLSLLLSKESKDKILTRISDLATLNKDKCSKAFDAVVDILGKAREDYQQTWYHTFI